MTDQHLASTGGPGGRLARFASGKTSKWLVLGFWLVVFVVCPLPRRQAAGAQENDAASWLPGDAQSTQVLTTARRSRAATSSRPSSSTSGPAARPPADIAAVAAQIKQFADIEAFKRDPVGPIPSEDGSALQVIVPIDAGSGGWEALGTAVDEIRDIADDRPAGLSVHVTGPAGFAADSSEAFAGIDGKLLYSRGRRRRPDPAADLPQPDAVARSRCSPRWRRAHRRAGGRSTSSPTHAGLTVNAQSAGILTVLVFGAGTDYALLLVARYREELRRHEDRHEAMAFALHRAGPAIFASGSTVIAGMLCLLFAEHELHAGTRPGRRRSASPSPCSSC